jgi:hypothetical protein
LWAVSQLQYCGCEVCGLLASCSIVGVGLWAVSQLQYSGCEVCGLLASCSIVGVGLWAVSQLQYCGCEVCGLLASCSTCDSLLSKQAQRLAIQRNQRTPTLHKGVVNAHPLIDPAHTTTSSVAGERMVRCLHFNGRAIKRFVDGHRGDRIYTNTYCALHPIVTA